VNLPNLHSLSLAFNAVGNAGVQSLAASPLLGQFGDLYLNGNRGLGDPALSALANSERAGNLRRLDLSNVELTEAGVKAVAHSARLARLSRLDLIHCRLFDGAAKHIGFSTGLPQLRELRLARNSLTDAGATALAVGTRRRLRVLDLGRNHVSSETA